jgi:hypothetical protein
MNLTVHNTGCGLGDMLNRIDVIYRYCVRRGFNFVFPDISSALHEQDYAAMLGLDEIRPRKAEWPGPQHLIPFDALFQEQTPTESDDDSTLFAVQYDHAESHRLLREFNLGAVNGFDFRPHVAQRIFPHPTKGELDLVIHLRLGDNFAYRLPDGRVLDSGNRRIVACDSLMEDTFKLQWTIDDVAQSVSWLNAHHKSYSIHCDGIESVIRHIRWAKDPEYVECREMLYQTVRTFLESFKQQTRHATRLHIGNKDIVAPIRDMMSASQLVYTTGGFMRSINRFFNSPPTPAIHIKAFVEKIRTAE